MNFAAGVLCGRVCTLQQRREKPVSVRRRYCGGIDLGGETRAVRPETVSVPVSELVLKAVYGPLGGVRMVHGDVSTSPLLSEHGGQRGGHAAITASSSSSSSSHSAVVGRRPRRRSPDVLPSVVCSALLLFRPPPPRGPPQSSSLPPRFLLTCRSSRHRRGGVRRT